MVKRKRKTPGGDGAGTLVLVLLALLAVAGASLALAVGFAAIVGWDLFAPVDFGRFSGVPALFPAALFGAAGIGTLVCIGWLLVGLFRKP